MDFTNIPGILIGNEDFLNGIIEYAPHMVIALRYRVLPGWNVDTENHSVLGNFPYSLHGQQKRIPKCQDS